MEIIKERFVIEALADIERNRRDGRNVEEAIEYVTGYSAKEIYEDAKRSLVKRYSKERTISEGKTISDKYNNIYFYKPAVVLDDGSFITYRRKKNNSGEIIKFCPEKKEGVTFPKDKDKDYNKDVLFVANVCNELSVTADKEQNVYTASQDFYRNKLPGPNSIVRIYKWNKRQELKPLTTGNKSYFQPSVSRDGSTLVACTQNKTKMQLERIDTQSGKSTVLLSNPAYDFIQPSVNSDGTKVTFLAVSDTQAKIGYISIDKDFNAKAQTEFLTVESAEDKNKIYDLSLPTFTKENTITFCSNKRGRLEVFETEKIETEKKYYGYKCVVSDPVGALWADKNKNGIYYMSYSSTGNVIKIKPQAEWGKVPAFDGPSKSGEIVPVSENFDDYKNFNPFEKKLDEKIKKREDKFIKKAEEIQNQEIKPVSFDNEKIYFPLPSNLLRLPLLNAIGKSDDMHIGFGAMLIYKYPNINYQENYLLFDCLYYPTINQLEGNFAHIFYNYSFMTFLLLNRELFKNEESANPFTETNTILASIKFPFVNETKINSSFDFSLISHAGIYFERSSSAMFSINDDIAYNKNYYASIGLDYFYEVESKLLKYKKLSTQALFQYVYNETKQTNEYGIEGEIEFDCDISDITNSINLRANYSNFSSILPTAITRMNVAGKNISTELPYNLIVQESLLFYNFLSSGLDFKPYLLGQFSTDIKSYEFKFYTGFETGLSIKQNFIRLGLSMSLEENSELSFYITTKIGSLRN